MHWLVGIHLSCEDFESIWQYILRYSVTYYSARDHLPACTVCTCLGMYRMYLCLVLQDRMQRGAQAKGEVTPRQVKNDAAVDPM